MRDRAFWAFVALAALMLATAYWWRNQMPSPVPSKASATVVGNVSAPAAAPTAVAASASPTITSVRTGVAQLSAAEKKPKTEVAIQEGKTIDFSSGVAVVKDDAKQKAAIDRALKEMEDALHNVTFAPPAQKEAEPTPAPPKP